ncbi:MAG: hypothetical protein H7Z18_11810 [Methylophilaceae bacterium]|nr:hypothetical protein [Methylophilaceae bacterium]
MIGSEFEEFLQDVMHTGQAKTHEIRIENNEISSIYLFNVLSEKNTEGDVIGAVL